MTTWARTTPVWMAFGVVSKKEDGTPGYTVYLSDEVDHIDLEPEYVDVMSSGSAAAVSRSVAGIDFRGRMRGVEMAFSELSTAAAAASVGLNELLGAIDSGLRPQLELLYYACVDHIETPEEVEAFEVLAEYLGV